MSLLGADLGTTGGKAAVFSDDGRCLAQAYREYDILHPQPGWAELDSQEVWRKTKDIIREVEGHLGVGLNAVTPDGEFSFEAVRCLGCCGLAPVMVINGEVYGKLETSQLPGILAKYKQV